MPRFDEYPNGTPAPSDKIGFWSQSADEFRNSPASTLMGVAGPPGGDGTTGETFDSANETLTVAANRAVTNRRDLFLPSGSHSIPENQTFGGSDNWQGFTLHGPPTTVQQQNFRNGEAIYGAHLNFANNRRLILDSGQENDRSVCLKDFTITGNVNNALVDGDNGFSSALAQGGIMKNISILNTNQSANACGVKAGALYGCVVENLVIANANGNNWNSMDPSTHGGLAGFYVTGTGRGGGGIVTLVNVHGWPVGFLIGSAYNETLERMSSVEIMKSQASYNAIGFWARSNAPLYLEDCFAEFCHTAAKVSDNGTLRVGGGTFSCATKAGWGQPLCGIEMGDDLAARNNYQSAVVEYANFAFLENMGVYVHGHDGTSETNDTVIRGCTANQIGAADKALVGLAAPDGNPDAAYDVLVDGFGGAKEDAHNTVADDHLVRFRHNQTDQGDARQYCRIINVPSNFTAGIEIDREINFNTTKRAPHTAKLVAGSSIVTGSRPPFGDKHMWRTDAHTPTLRKRAQDKLYVNGSLKDGTTTSSQTYTIPADSMCNLVHVGAEGLGDVWSFVGPAI